MDHLFSLLQDLSIEEQYRQLDLAMLALKSRRNALSLLHRLPAEIICDIFIFVQFDENAGRYSQNLKNWIGVTHISRHLRNIAINCPSLWVNPPLYNLQWTKEMLKRSKDADLFIHVIFRYGPIPLGLLGALQHSAHIASLALSSLDPVQWDEVIKYLPRSAPRLDFLSIHGYLAWDADDENPALDHPASISIPEHVLREANQLRYLELTRCNLNWNSHSHLLRSLKSLAILNPFPDSRLTRKQLMAVLNEMPDLERLRFRRALSLRADNEASWTPDHIHLASLESLEMDDTIAELEAFFSRITFPPTTSVQITVVLRAPTGTNAISNRLDTSRLMSAIFRSYANLNLRIPSRRLVFQTLVLSLEPWTATLIGLCLDLSKNERQLFNRQQRHLTLRLFGVFLPERRFPTSRVFTEVFTDVFSTTHLQHIQVAHVLDQIPGLDPETIVNTLGKLPLLRFVTVVGAAAGWSFLNALNLRSQTASTESGSLDSGPVVMVVPFPCLSSILLSKMMFTTTSTLSNPYAITIGMLQDCLIRRREAGMEMESLILQDCRNFRPQDAGSLTKIVVSVDWDGKETLDDDSGDEDDDSD